MHTENLIRDIKSDDNLDLQTDILVKKFKDSDHADLIIFLPKF